MSFNVLQFQCKKYQQSKSAQTPTMTQAKQNPKKIKNSYRFILECQRPRNIRNRNNWKKKKSEWLTTSGKMMGILQANLHTKPQNYMIDRQMERWINQQIDDRQKEERWIGTLIDENKNLKAFQNHFQNEFINLTLTFEKYLLIKLSCNIHWGSSKAMIQKRYLKSMGLQNWTGIKCKHANRH